MGQKVKGYRRGSDYGRSTNVKGTISESRSNRKKNQYKGWGFEVNPVGQYGWTQGSSGNSEEEYGLEWIRKRERRQGVEEVRESYGCRSNGRGVKGTKLSGYTVYGEYLVLGEKESYDNKAERRREAKLNRRVVHYRRRWRCGRKRKRVSVHNRREKYDEKKEVKRLMRNTAGRRKRRRMRGKERVKQTVTHENMAQAVARSGIVPNEVRRSKRVARELEGTLGHIEVRRERKARMTAHASRYVTKGGKSVKDGYRGYKVTVKGVVGGAIRTITYTDHSGVIPNGTKQARMGSHDTVAKTSVGTRGVRVEYCYGRG